jgi:hypothetical protein
MVNTKQFGKSIIFIALLLVFCQSAFGLGLVPSSKELIYEPEQAHTVQVKIINNDGFAYDALVYAEGPLGEYITLHDELISFAEGETEKIISYTLALPASLSNQGLLESEIIVRQVPKKSGSTGSQVSASIAVGHKVKVNVPITGQYAKSTLFVGNFQFGKESNFAVEVVNLGDEDIFSTHVLIDIMGPFNNKIVSLRSDPVSIKSKETKIINVPWTPKIGAGAYRAVATTVYDEKNTVSEDTFTLGEPTVSVDSIDVSSFKLGGIAKFAIAIGSNWNLPIDEIYAETVVKDDSGEVLSQYKTADTYLDPFGKQIIDAFWDTSKAISGVYTLEISMHYLEKTNSELFEIVVEEDGITTKTTGKVIDNEAGEEQSIMRYIYLLLFLVVGLIVFNIYMFLRKKKND